MNIEKELISLRKFKSDSEETCSSLVIIDKLNEELEEERKKLNEEIQKWKQISEDKENHINNVYSNLCLTILFSLETELLDYGVTRFNLHDKCEEVVSAPDIIDLLKQKLLGLMKVHNIENTNYTFYYHKNEYDWWFIVGDPIELMHYENMIDLVCPAFDMYYTECSCNRCLNYRSGIEQSFIEENNLDSSDSEQEEENEFDY
jgi:hypothetical protein|tara:strand:- start:550 stop:1158 length:609 start_codon:yes stop_codon:yes gene_type:complete